MLSNDKNIKKEKTGLGYMSKAIIILAGVALAFIILVCGFFCYKNVLHQKEEINKYNVVRYEEISRMAEFLNDKYDLDLQEKDCVYYREEDYTRHSDMMGNGTTYNIPYIAVFKNDNETITVTDRKGFISDNRQLKEINHFVADYYSRKTGINFDYVEFGKSYVGSWSGNDNVINTVLQTRFNKRITEDNVEELINYILQESALSVTFYIKSSGGNREALINDITGQLSYLKGNSNIEILEVYGYDNELDIKHREIDFPEEQRDYGNSSDDYDDGYKFGCYYVDTDSTDFTFSLAMELERGYTIGTGQKINGWGYRELEVK